MPWKSNAVGAGIWIFSVTPAFANTNNFSSLIQDLAIKTIGYCCLIMGAIIMTALALYPLVLRWCRQEAHKQHLERQRGN